MKIKTLLLKNGQLFKEQNLTASNVNTQDPGLEGKNLIFWVYTNKEHIGKTQLSLE